MPRDVMENTLPGFLRAVDAGADAVELDAHVTKDGVVVVHHDDAVGSKPIAQTQWKQLAELDLGHGSRVPRLDDVMRAIGDSATVYVELKGKDIEDVVIPVCRQFGRRFALHSFDHSAMARVARKAPDLPRGILLDRDVTRPVDVLRAAANDVGPRDVWPHWSLVDEAFVRAAHDLGTRVIAWTVNSRAAATTLVALGVDAICTDDVRLLANLS
jgi:glycerophosphoryl diester phosphodiesterase